MCEVYQMTLDDRSPHAHFGADCHLEEGPAINKVVIEWTAA